MAIKGEKFDGHDFVKDVRHLDIVHYRRACDILRRNTPRSNGPLIAVQHFLAIEGEVLRLILVPSEDTGYRSGIVRAVGHALFVGSGEIEESEFRILGAGAHDGVGSIGDKPALRIADIGSSRRKDIGVRGRIGVLRIAVSERTIIVILPGEMHTLDDHEASVLLADLMDLGSDIIIVRLAHYLRIELGESEGVVNEFGDIRCSDHTCIASEDRALNTSGAPSYFLRGTHGVDIIVIRRNAELWLVRITPNSEPVTADENLLADLIHTGAGTQVHGDAEVLLLAVNDHNHRW